MNIIRLGLRSILLAGAATALTAAASADNVETVVVTGSRIAATNATSPSPVSVATSAQIEMTSAFSLGDVLQTMIGPDATAGITSASNNGGVGLSEIGLRELGPSRTLVLVDGQRLIPIFSGASSVPDLNTVPVAMVDRVEVLRDGASSIYGADAVGGVINIITKKDFDGLQIDASGGTSQHGGGDTYNVSATLGVNLDRGNITFSLLNEYQAVVDGKDRSWVQNPHLNDPNGFDGGSSFRSQLNIMQDANSHTVWNNGVETTYNNPALGSVPCLTYLPGPGRVKLNANCPSVSPAKTLTSALGRTQISFNGHYDLTPDVTFIAQGFFTDRHSEQRLRPEPLLGSLIASTNPITGVPVYNGFEVPVDWPGYSDPNHTASVQPCADPNGCIQGYLTPNEFGPRDYKQVSETYRVRVGLQGTIAGAYNWEIGYVQQRNDTVQRVYNSGNWMHLAEATGALPCLDVPGGCTYSPLFGHAIPAAPFNFFKGVGTLTPEQVAYLTFTMTDTNYSNENFAYADINGPLFELPGGTVEGSLGVERRFEHLADSPDSLVQQGWASNPSAATSGGYNVSSIYGELRIPLLKNVPLAQSLIITPSARYDHYSSFGDAKTWKVGADWQVTDDIRLRGTYATGFRAPSVAELFGGQGISYISVDGDPCDSRAPGFNGNSNAGLGSLASGSACYNQLTAQGLTPAQIAAYQSPENNLSSDQRGLIIGGNPNLKPELSHSWNVGVVLTPGFLNGFSFDADYYSITVTNSILTGGIALNSGPDLVVLGCYAGQNPAYCSLITRNPGGIFQISSLNTNFGISKEEGLEMQATYQAEAKDLGLPLPGAFSFDLQGERLFTSTTQNPDGTVNDFVGKFVYSNESVQPVWRSTLAINYTLEDLMLHWDTTYVGHTADFDGGPAVPGNAIPDYFYHNISAALDVSGFGPAKATRLIAGINNLFDKDPPFLSGDSVCKCNSLAGPYDFIGRFFYVRLSTKF